MNDASKLCELTNWRDADGVAVLAAAYAESGNYRKAVEQQQKAIELATSESERERFQAQLKLYKHKKPYRLQVEDAVRVVSASAKDEDDDGVVLAK